MTTWDDIRENINSWDTTNPTIRSNVSSILEIIDTAEKWNMCPEVMENITKSNLREIIKRAKKLINLEDHDGLKQLFFDATELTTTDLRKKLRPEALEKIQVEVVQTEKGKLYRMEVTKDKYDRMVRSLERLYHFIEIYKEKD